MLACVHFQIYSKEEKMIICFFKYYMRISLFTFNQCIRFLWKLWKTSDKMTVILLSQGNAWSSILHLSDPINVTCTYMLICPVSSLKILISAISNKVTVTVITYDCMKTMLNSNSNNWKFLSVIYIILWSLSNWK